MANPNTPNLHLSAAHQTLIARSCISPVVSAEREYRTIIAVEQAIDVGFTEPFQQRLPALVLPIRNVKGEIAMYRIRPDSPRLNSKNKPVKYESAKGTKICLDVPKRSFPHLGDISVPLYFTEGERKADCLASLGLCVVGLCGVWGWRSEGKPLDDFDAINFVGRRVAVLFDSDIRSNRTVYQAAHVFAAFLQARGAKVTILEIPSAADGSKQGVDDYVYAGGRIEDLRDLHAKSDIPRQVVTVDPAQITEHVDIAEAAIATSPFIFVQNSRIVRITIRRDGDPDLARVKVEPLPKATAMELIAQRVDWMKSVRGNTSPVVTPKEVIDGLFARGAWPKIRNVKRLITHPFVTLDGQVISQNGFHAGLGIYLESDVSIDPIPDVITDADVAEAMTILREPTEAVRFADADSRDVPVLMVLTTVDLPNGAKPPCFFVTAPFPRSGKTFIAHQGHIVTHGRSAATATLSSSSEEVRKAITTFVQEGRSVVVLDNLPNGHHVASADLDQFLTSKVRLDRRLGTNESIEAVSNMSVVVTGNNVTAGEDTIRRIVPCRIGRPYPQLPPDHPHYAADPIAMLIAKRPKLLWGGLLILAWFRRLLPEQQDRTLVIPSFEEWSRNVLHPFRAAGGNFNSGSADDLADADDWSNEAIEQIVRAAIGNGSSEGFTTSDVVRWSKNNPDLLQALESAVEDGPVNAWKIGRFINRSRNRPVVIDEACISIDARKKTESSRTRKWFLQSEPIDQPDTAPDTSQTGSPWVSGYLGFKTEIPRAGENHDVAHERAPVRTCEGGSGNETAKPVKPTSNADSNEPPDARIDLSPSRLDESSGTCPPRHEPPTSDDDDDVEFERVTL